MKSIFQKYPVKCFLVISCTAILSIYTVQAQICPQPIATTITSYTNTYYPGLQPTVNAGSTSLSIDAATYGTTPISAGDLLLIIQMQGTNLETLPAGIYFVKASDGARCRNGKLVIHHNY